MGKATSKQRSLVAGISGMIQSANALGNDSDEAKQSSSEVETNNTSTNEIIDTTHPIDSVTSDDTNSATNSATTSDAVSDTTSVSTGDTGVMNRDTGRDISSEMDSVTNRDFDSDKKTPVTSDMGVTSDTAFNVSSLSNEELEVHSSIYAFTPTRHKLFEHFVTNAEQYSICPVGIGVLEKKTTINRRTLIRNVNFLVENNFIKKGKSNHRGTIYYVSSFHHKIYMSLKEKGAFFQDLNENISGSDISVTSDTTPQSPSQLDDIKKERKVLSLYSSGAYEHLLAARFEAASVEQALAERIAKAEDGTDPLSNIDDELEFLNEWARQHKEAGEFMKAGWYFKSLREGVRRPDGFITPAELKEEEKLKELKRKNQLREEIYAQEQIALQAAITEEAEAVYQQGESHELYQAAFELLHDFQKKYATKPNNPIFKASLMNAVKKLLSGE